MSLKKVLEQVKKEGEDKVPFRFQFPITLKDEFSNLCDKHNVSMSDMIIGLIKTSIDEDNGLYDTSALSIINKLEILQATRNIVEQNINNGHDEPFYDEKEGYIDFKKDYQMLTIQIESLLHELEKKGLKDENFK